MYERFMFHVRQSLLIASDASTTEEQERQVEALARTIETDDFIECTKMFIESVSFNLSVGVEQPMTEQQYDATVRLIVVGFMAGLGIGANVDVI